MHITPLTMPFFLVIVLTCTMLVGCGDSTRIYNDTDNLFTDDLIVDHNDTLTGDVVVVNGDVTIEEGGEVLGNLVVATGDIEVQAGGRVQGDVTIGLGDAEMAGKIHGDLSAPVGDVELIGNAFVGGDVSVLAGEFEQSEDAQVEGHIITGLEKRANSESSLGLDVRADLQQDSPSAAKQLIGFVLRLAAAAFYIIGVSVGTGLLARYKPAYVESVRQRLHTEMTSNFTIGLLFNMVLGFLTVIFAVLICLLPMSLVLGGLLLIVNGAGWTATAAIVGRQLTGYTDKTFQSVATVVLGAIALTTPLAALWAIGGSLSLLSIMAAVAIASAGAGSVLSPWLKRISSQEIPY